LAADAALAVSCGPGSVVGDGVLRDTLGGGAVALGGGDDGLTVSLCISVSCMAVLTTRVACVLVLLLGEVDADI
jgi:hypothetical protein